MAKTKKAEGVICKLENSLGEFFLKKLPGLPNKIKEIIVKIGPWIALIGLVMSLPTLLAAFGLRGMFMPGYYSYGYSFGYSVAWWVSIASLVLMAVALPGLFKRKMSSWKLMFYSSLVMAVYYLATFSIGSLIIGTGVSMYILFQIKSYYK